MKILQTLSGKISNKYYPDSNKYFPSESGRWIRRSLEAGGRVMVNCWQGASRSATVVLAFLMMHHDMELATVLAQVKSRRDIRPNNGFLRQLLTLEDTLNTGE